MRLTETDFNGNRKDFCFKIRNRFGDKRKKEEEEEVSLKPHFEIVEKLIFG